MPTRVLNDLGGRRKSRTEQKYLNRSQLEDLECVDASYINRVYNRVDSSIKGRNKAEREASRDSGETYQKFLRALADDICLQRETMKQRQQNAIKRSRVFLTRSFFDKLGMHGVEIDRNTWTWTETGTVEEVAEVMGA